MDTVPRIRFIFIPKTLRDKSDLNWQKITNLKLECRYINEFCYENWLYGRQKSIGNFFVLKLEQWTLSGLLVDFDW